MRHLIFAGILLTGLMSSCKNQDWEFPDYDYQTVYFANQYPIRTITFGEDIFDTTVDNQGKFQVFATTGGVYTTHQDVTIDIEVDNDLCKDLKFDNNSGQERDVQPLPENYYTISSNKIIIPKGSLIGSVEVQLTDEFFQDPLALTTNYVLPLKMTQISNADSILSGGAPVKDNPHPGLITDWDPAPKNFTLYAIKYINTWHGVYLRRGVDNIEGQNGHDELTGVSVRRQADIENDEVKNMTTIDRNIANLALSHAGVGGANINSNLRLTFDDNGNCTITTTSSDYIATGTGKFVKRGEKNSWGGQDRDALYLEYVIDHPIMKITTKDTLVMRNRGVSMESFSPSLK